MNECCKFTNKYVCDIEKTINNYLDSIVICFYVSTHIFIVDIFNQFVLLDILVSSSLVEWTRIDYALFID